MDSSRQDLTDREWWEQQAQQMVREVRMLGRWQEEILSGQDQAPAPASPQARPPQSE